MDNDFEVLRDDLRDNGITLNTTAADENIPQIEIQTKVAKEGIRSTWNSLPYKKNPNRMISCMVGNAFFGLNPLSANSGMSCTISPWTLMMGTTIDFKKHWNFNLAHTPRRTKKPFHKTPRNPAQNPLSALDQQETFKVPIGS